MNHLLVEKQPMRCELCGERIKLSREDEARECARCAAVMEDSISGESMFGQDTLAEWKHWLKKTENHRPCPGVRGINGLLESSKTSSTSRGRSFVAKSFSIMNSLNIDPARNAQHAALPNMRTTSDGAHLAEDITTKHCLFQASSSSTQPPLPIAVNQAEDAMTTPSDDAHLAETPQVVCLEDALTLVQRARREAGHDQESTRLDTEEFQKALDFLQKIFEDDFMQNAQLKARIRNLQEKPEEFCRNTKRKIRVDRRNAFRAWTRQLMGNVHFLHAVMRNGTFQIRDQQDLASAFLHAYSSVDEHHADSSALWRVGDELQR